MRSAVPAGDFVGRTRELAALDAALDSARAGFGPLVVVHGEAGIGKTRTVAEFTRRAADQGAVVLWGTCYQGGVTQPYGPWVEALAGLPDAPAAVELPTRERRLRLYEAVVQFLESIDGPPILVLDDLQWADADALELLVHVARYATRPLIVGLHRGGELDLAHPVTQRLAEASRQRPSEYLLLSNLTLDEAAALLERAARRPVEAEVVEAIYAESGGNPFFLGELGRHLHQRGPPQAFGSWRPPETVRQAVGLRLAGLSAQARHMLERAAVFTAGFGFDELLALTELDEDALLDCLDEALAAEVIRPIAPERYDFAHTLVRHTLYESFSASRRARLHRRLADVLEYTHAERLAEVAGELARQYHASATLPGAERGVPPALMAAAQARAAPAPGETVAFLQIALDLAPGIDAAMRATIARDLALAQAEAAMLEEAPHTLHTALDLLEATGAPADSIADVVYQVVSVLQDALANQAPLEPLIARGVAALGEERSLAWARLKLLERPCESVPAGPVHAARWLGFDPEAVRIVRSEGTEVDRARTVDQFAPWRVSDVQAIARSVGPWRDPVARLRVLVVLTWNLTVTRWSGPTAPPGEGLCAEIEALGAGLGSVPPRAMASMFRSATLGARGEFEAASACLAEARPFVERLPPDHRVTLVATLIGELTVQHIAPDWPRLAARMFAIATRRGQVPWFGLAWAGVATHAYARAGMRSEARALLEDILPGITAADPWDYAQNLAVAAAGEAIWELRDPELAEWLLPSAIALIVANVGDYYMASNDLTAARLAAVLGRFDDAVGHFARARAVVEAREQRPLQAIVDHDEAVLRIWMKRPGAAALLSSAKDRFAALGMAEWTRRAALQQVADDELPDGLTPREAEILRLVAAGRTNKEIAASLVVSVHTVERHVQNAYRKISVRNRADATAYVLRAEL